MARSYPAGVLGPCLLRHLLLNRLDNGYPNIVPPRTPAGNEGSSSWRSDCVHGLLCEAMVCANRRQLATLVRRLRARTLNPRAARRGNWLRLANTPLCKLERRADVAQARAGPL